MADQQAVKFLEELTNCFGPSGFEREPARIVKSYVSRYSDDVYTDKLGSLMFKKKGTSDKPVVLLPGHVDEVGFIISSIVLYLRALALNNSARYANHSTARRHILNHNRVSADTHIAA